MMTAPQRTRARSRLADLVLSLVIVALLPAAAFAQAKPPVKEPTPEEKKGYTLPYFFVAVGILAVTMTVCWPANRKWEVKVKGEE